MDHVFVLVEDHEQGEQGWYLLVERYKEDELTEVIEFSSKNMMQQYLDGRPGLTEDRVKKFTWERVSNCVKWLSEGHKLLFNRNGGMRFFDDSLKLLRKEVYPIFKFPAVKETVGLSGWLSPQGVFHFCYHGYHSRFAIELEDDGVEDREDYIHMSCHYNSTALSVVTLTKEPTEAQQEWIKGHFHLFDTVQQRCIAFSEYFTEEELNNSAVSNE